MDLCIRDDKGNVTEVVENIEEYSFYGDDKEGLSYIVRRISQMVEAIRELQRQK